MTTTLRWGLLGTAHINRRLIPAMRTARRSALLAVASRDGDRARAYAREWKLDVAHDSYDALVRDRRIDAVYIPLPNSLHVEWTLRALDAGKHVLCEKPLALTADDVDRISAVARARTLVVAEAFMYRHEPLIARVVEVVRDGAIGEPWLINTGFSYQQSRVPDVRLDPALGGGSLWDIGCYAVNVARLVAGDEPVSVVGTATRRGAVDATAPGGPGGDDIDDAFSGILTFRKRLTATVHSSFCAAYRTWLEIFGSAGAVRVRNPFRPSAVDEIEIHRDEAVRRIAVAGSPELFVRQVEDFVTAVLDGKTPTVSLADSRGNAATLAALHASARSGRALTI